MEHREWCPRKENHADGRPGSLAWAHFAVQSGCSLWASTELLAWMTAGARPSPHIAASSHLTSRMLEPKTPIEFESVRRLIHGRRLTGH
ncbi:hypothetical protein CCMA1212_005433 [Trichoderma ghanense]|uniref:Uncharacterized protein n=1 Tax=Trichoderma ghanense TaxID=65468 RepID=A0ABY2H4A3_9HYPO